MSYVTVKDLKVGYEGQVVASGISFQVNKGDYLCIVGENGSGKSTLVKTLLHLQEPLGGEILYGEDLR
ncbi:MAG: ATP-binding cassette domain-containing protein, partial [Lachnospiraceae bacterium]|nr:ATP-binding cassette domain-containing protein [Lachnospiraceae bacterium]